MHDKPPPTLILEFRFPSEFAELACAITGVLRKNDKMDQILTMLTRIVVSQQTMENEMTILDDQLAGLQTSVDANTSAEASAEVLINGIPQLISTAVSQALAAGPLTAAQQAIFTSLNATLTANASTLAAAVVAGTPVDTTSSGTISSGGTVSNGGTITNGGTATV